MQLKDVLLSYRQTEPVLEPFRDRIQLLPPPGVDVASAAVAVTPRGASHASSLEFRAEGYTLLEYLVVRSNPFGDVIFVVRGVGDSSALHAFPVLGHSRGKPDRASTRRPKSWTLTFLVECGVELLRLGVDNVGDEELAQCPVQLGELLAVNPRLTSLTLVASRATLSDCVAQTFTKIQSLRHLGALTTTLCDIQQCGCLLLDSGGELTAVAIGTRAL
ncbi:hypothetical protein MTO96_029804 [Rhipicephalus appendiculatus]